MRAALARIAVAVTTMVALSFVVPLGLLNGQIARDRALNAAVQQAESLVPVLTITADPAALKKAVGSTSAGAAGHMTLYPHAGPPIGAPRTDPADLRRASTLHRSFTTPARGGTLLLRPVLLRSGEYAVVEVFIPDSEFGRGVINSWVILVLVALALVLVSVAMADRLAVRVVAAADRLAQAVTRVARGDLAARVEPDGPAELRAAGEAFNHMADQLARLLAAEREAAADLSHRLRTPLTALRVNLNGLAANPADPARMSQSQDALGRLELAIDEIIDLARRDDRETARCDAAEVVRRRLEFWSALADDQDREVDVLLPDDPLPVPVAAAELAAAVDALLGNIFRHTPHGTPFSVTVHRGRDTTGLLFSDAGPGVAEPEAALRRGASGAGSTGLGLDIARRLAESTGGSLRIDTSPMGGAQIQVWLRTGEKPLGTRSPRSRRRRSGRR
ncbi:sensor histidine kinase [Actinomadura logoneensis]|uniref:histidine kinase n=1 Tax=Actinomadura logoneensis TaxID=2293572 RepID=A0A372J977_9ACTN|nr:HAMP domain-containing sensor histidine kinase [Actinomadura logoneensis]RFU36364.1 sensor histidine kinase [Actinomadura logoneensis]